MKDKGGVTGVWLLEGQEGQRRCRNVERHEPLLCGKTGEGNEGIFSGLFGIIEVRPSAGVCVGGALVIQRGGGEERRRGGKENEGIRSLSRSGSH